MSKKYFVTGIGTDVGKTIVSAILVEALKADYFKPVQCGDLDNSDTAKVRDLISNRVTQFHASSYAFQEPASPHYAAELENKKVDLNKIKLPSTNEALIIEGAGGILVPLNREKLILDLVAKWDVEVIVVSRNYLGSINHTLLTIQALQERNITIKGIIFNDTPNEPTESVILEYTGVTFLGRVLNETSFDRSTIKRYASNFEFLKN